MARRHARPPHLVTIFPMVASTSLYHNWITQRRLASLVQFRVGGGPAGVANHANTGIHTMKNGPESQRYETVLPHLPLIDMPQLLGRHPQFYTDWIHHPYYDAYWKAINAEEVFDHIEIPVHTHGGWFDIFTAGTQNGYIGVSQHGGTKTARRLEPHDDRPMGARCFTKDR